MNPYRLLGITRDAGDSEIRQAYLNALKEAPPESNPERFAALNHAYESIKDERSRYKYELLNKECPGESPLDALVCYGRLQKPPRPLALDAMKKFLRKCAEI